MSNEFPPFGFVRLKQILTVLPYGPSTWWAGVAAGRFPSPLKIGPNTTVWRVEDILELIKKLSDQQATPYSPSTLEDLTKREISTLNEVERTRKSEEGNRAPPIKRKRRTQRHSINGGDEK
jgi:predicted DNA-binding transcriptional regulator AlpA